LARSAGAGERVAAAARRDQRVDAERREQQGGGVRHRLERDLRRRSFADQHDRNVGEQHSERGPDHDRGERFVLRRKQNGRDLRLVAHLGDEERADGDAEDAPAGCGRRRTVVELVGTQRPDGDGKERQRDEPLQHAGRNQSADEIAEETCERVIGKRRHQNSRDDRHRLLEARGEHEREQLRLVADLAEGDDACGNEKGLHGNG
jgi:hypothetical protein